jgi:wyosine [tRNA(Phe)-imidazoG37] synthetase (radical SAM superfamily)
MIPKNNEMRIETTTKCNYNCVICPRDRFTRIKETMSLELFETLFKKIVLETRQYNTLTFSGFGEPLLDPTLDDKIRFAKNYNFDVLILSNGSLLTAKRFQELENLGVKSIRVSMYGITPETYARVHGLANSAQFENIKTELTRIAEIKKTTGLILTYNVVEGVNDRDTEKWIEYWKDRADLIEVWRPHNWVNGREYRPVQEKKVKTCGRPWNTPLQVQVDGTVNMCCFDYNGSLLLGDLNNQTLTEIFDSDRFKKILHHHKTGEFTGSHLICKNCDQRNATKTHVMEYNSKFKIEDRVEKLSTTYTDLI